MKHRLHCGSLKNVVVRPNATKLRLNVDGVPGQDRRRHPRNTVIVGVTWSVVYAGGRVHEPRALTLHLRRIGLKIPPCLLCACARHFSFFFLFKNYFLCVNRRFNSVLSCVTFRLPNFPLAILSRSSRVPSSSSLFSRKRSSAV